MWVGDSLFLLEKFWRVRPVYELDSRSSSLHVAPRSHCVDRQGRAPQSLAMTKPALGRGLGALMGGSSAVTKSEGSRAPAMAVNPPGERVEKLAVGRIRPCSLQPRKSFSEESIKELADSIKEQGILTPLLVRKKGEGYELIAGERRWRAAQAAGLTEVPALVKEADDRKTLELALIENLQREDLNAIEEALGYKQLADQFGLTQDQIAARMGKARSAVANSLRLLNLSNDVQGFVRKGILSVGHAKLLLGLSSGAEQDQLARDSITGGMSVRALEDLIAGKKSGGTHAGAAGTNGKASPTKFVVDANISALQEKLRERLGSKVLLRYRKGKGAIEVRFFNDDDLERILGVLGVSVD
jgi:ParB family chromosome partitioning protein